MDDMMTVRVMWPCARGVWSSVTLLALSLCLIVALGEGFIATSPLLRWYKFCRSPGDDLVNVLRDRSWTSHHRYRDYSRITLTQAHEDADVQELRLLTWMEVESRIQRDIEHTGAAAAIVPIGATEQHGPTGLIGTDHMTAEAVARGVSAATGTLVTPCVNFGMSCHHGSFAGTVTLTPATFVGVVRDVADSLFRSGFTHVLFINGHGGNIAPTFKAFADLMGEGEDKSRPPNSSPSSGSEAGHTEGEKHDAPFSGRGGVMEQGTVREDSRHAMGDQKTSKVKLVNWYMGKNTAALAKELYGDEVGQHATPDEVAITQHLFPSSIKAGVPLDPAAIQVARELEGRTTRNKDEATGLFVMDSGDFRRRFPDGRMYSNPGLATPDHGRRLLDVAVQDATEVLLKFISGEDVIEDKATTEAAAVDAGVTTRKKPRFRRRWEDDKTRGSGGTK